MVAHYSLPRVISIENQFRVHPRAARCGRDLPAVRIGYLLPTSRRRWRIWKQQTWRLNRDRCNGKQPEVDTQCLLGILLVMKPNRSSAGLFLYSACLVLFETSRGWAQLHSGGGPRLEPTSNCISAAEQAQLEAIIANRPAPQGDTIIPYPFVPIAGNVWDDRFINNYVDLDPTPGILDWDCTDFTYDGHTGHDIDLRSFGEMDAGVPVFAALDGTVVTVHDWEFDRNVSQANQPANYVVIYHGGTQYTWYYHLRRGSISVVSNQVVKAGTQIGLAGSSGNSTAPHLHFESRYNGTYFEPSAGNCRTGATDWVNQLPIRRDLWMEDFGMHNAATIPDGSFLPYEPPRLGTFVRSDTAEPVGVWYILHNQPANSTWRARYLRPDNTQFFDSGIQSYGNTVAYRYGTWWLWYEAALDTNGVWTLEFSVDGQVQVRAPFLVVSAGTAPTNRPPNAVTASFDPPAPGTNDVVFMRLTVPLLEDPDYDLMRYRYQWSVNGVSVREVTSAAHSDAIPHGLAPPGTVLSCTATPFDGTAYGPPVTVQVSIAGAGPQLFSQLVPGPSVVIAWPASLSRYVLQYTTPLEGNNWQNVSNAPVIVGAQNQITNAVIGSRFYRLKLGP
jgi:hypothetical protein